MSTGNITKLVDLSDTDLTESDALRKLKIELMMLSRLGIARIKVLHGEQQNAKLIGSIRAELMNLLKDEKIQNFCPGELFGPFEAEGREIAKYDQELRKDCDWAKANDYITIVCL